MSRKATSPPADEPGPDGTKTAGWWHESDEPGTLVCDLCPRTCRIGPGQRGFCFVRQNLGGEKMVSATYGRSTGFCIDPIEKKPLNQFYPGTPVLSFGTAGCNLGCKFCQNWTSSRSRQVDSAGEIAAPDAVAEAARQLGCRSVAFTYNDPIVWAEYAMDTARACRAAGVKTVAVTAGYINPPARETFFEMMDAANVDLKGFTESFYRDFSGGRLEPVLDTLRWLVNKSDVWVEITNLIIPQANDSPEDLERMCRWIRNELGPDVPLHFSAFHPDFKLTDRGPTPIDTLTRAHRIAKSAGLNYVYTGNVSDRTNQSTYCPGCGQVLIERDGYQLGTYALALDRCGHCGIQIAGRYDETPGTWGSRRQPVRISAYARAKPSEPKGDTAMTAKPSPGPNPDGIPEGRPKLTPEQEKLVFQAAGRRVAAAARSTQPERMDQVLDDLATVPLLGVFVSLKRAGQLRSCCGFMGQEIPLYQALDHAAVRAATDDPRFPPISPSELEHLDMEVWLLWGLEPVAATGRDRIGAVTIGKHGLQIARGNSRGLLLPGVAVEHKLDAETFLEHVCRKAGLPHDAWLDDDATLMTFEGYAVSGKLNTATEPESPAVVPGGPTQGELTALAEFCRGNLIAVIQGATPSYYLPGGYDGSLNGVSLTVHIPDSKDKVEYSKVSLRPEIPLQSSLFELVQAAAAVFKPGRIDLSHLGSISVGLTVFLDTAMHGTVEQPELSGIDPAWRAVLVASGPKWSVSFDPKKMPEELLDEALRRLRLPDPSGSAVCSMAVVSTESQSAASNVPHPQAGALVRPAAVAGQFYPAAAADAEKMLDEMLPERPTPEPWAAAMVPHAGWIYSGRLAADVLSRLEFPERVIVISPKHRPVGAEWAVAPHETWSLPTGGVPSDPELARQLAEAVDGLELDAVAHAQEHSIEVQLPIIARLAPESRVVGIAIHGGGYKAIAKFADQLAHLLERLPSRPLLVISSDMNHFADDAKTRKLDRMALDAMEELDPEKLFNTVRHNEISMCGMLPAVLVMETLRRLDSLNTCEPVGYATSADTTGDPQRVVGYAGMLLK